MTWRTDPAFCAFLVDGLELKDADLWETWDFGVDDLYEAFQAGRNVGRTEREGTERCLQS